jgi:hypothetical protein
MSTFIEDHGIFSLVRKGAVIYRGQTDAFDVDEDKNTAVLARNVISAHQHTYFGMDPESTALNYGITTGLVVNEDMRLLNINRPDAYQWLYDKADPDTRNAMDRAFPLENGVVMRDSDKDLDYKVLDFICRTGDYDGYIQPEMPKTDGGVMHSEMAVCKKDGIQRVLEPIGEQAVPDPDGRSYYSIKQETQLRKMSQQLEARRRAARAAARALRDQSGF